MSAARSLHSRRGRVARVAVPVATIALAAAACGSGSGAKATPAAAVGNPSSAAAGSGATLATRTGAVGAYLTDGSGKSLYEFASDSPTMSTCTGACTTYWPPLTSSSAITAGSGITASDIGSLTLPDGSKQVTYNGHPLYYFALDKAAGDTKGQGLDDFGAKWWLLSPSGSVIKASASTSSASNGYGY